MSELLTFFSFFFLVCATAALTIKGKIVSTHNFSFWPFQLSPSYPQSLGRLWLHTRINPRQGLTNTKTPLGLHKEGEKKQRNKHIETKMYLGKLHNVFWLLCFLLVKFWERADEKSFRYLQLSQYLKFLMTAFILQVRVWAETLGSIMHLIGRCSYICLHFNLPNVASAPLMQKCTFSLRFLLLHVLMNNWMNLPEVCLSCVG